MIPQNSKLLKLFNYDKAFEEDITDAIEHGYLVSNLAYLLSKELNMDESFCNMMSQAGMVHDIGKLQLGDYLYGRRQNALKIEEMKYVRLHPSLGAGFLSERSDVSEEICEIVKHHHENYDGSGYPDNIKGEDIPYGSRILRICDVYAALISKRPYRDAYDKDTALELMIEEVKNFDMSIFLAFMRVIHDSSIVEVEEYISRINADSHKL